MTGENSCILLNSVIASEMSLQLSKSNVLINVEIFCKLKDVINIEYKMKRVMRLFTLCGAVSMFLSIDQLINWWRSDVDRALSCYIGPRH